MTRATVSRHLPTLDHQPIIQEGPQGLFGSRYAELAPNTIDYWMLPDEPDMTVEQILGAVDRAPLLEEAGLQIYIHVPFCAQKCRFCAFSGGNSLDFKQAQRYAGLVISELRELVQRCPMKGRPIRSVNIGGGSPDLLREQIGTVLRAVRDLPGCQDDTEISVELTLSTTRQAFIDELARYGVTKASFGIQSLDPQVREHMRQPRSPRHLEQVLQWIDGRIPVVNADLITGFPGQTVGSAISDLRTLMAEPRLNCISSYLLTPGAAPSLMAGLISGELPPVAGHARQAQMRLLTYSTLLREGWVRCGTNSYVDPRRVDHEVVSMLAGNECIGARHYEDFLLAVGPQAVSYMPGVRIENRVDIEGWCSDMEHGRHPWHLPKCSTVHQRDTALWVFPLRGEGLPRRRFERMLEADALSEAQLKTFRELIDEGLIGETAAGYTLSILGEVFMGRLVQDLKQQRARRAVEEYVAEGRRLGQAIARGELTDENRANNRQIGEQLLHGGPQ